MSMFKETIDVSLTERAFLVENEVPVRYLRPGRTKVWALGKKIGVVRVRTSELVAELAPELRTLVPVEELVRVRVSATQRGLIVKRGRPVRVLLQGDYDVWVQDDVTVEVLDVSGVECAPLRDEARAVLVSKGYSDVTVPEGSIGLRFVDGLIDAMLPPGKHAAWTVQHDVNFVCIDLRERIVAITGQDVMTKDKVTLRMNASVTMRVADAKRVATASKDAEAALYLATQLALRDAVAAASVEQLLAQRELLSDAMLPVLRARADELGLAVVDVGVKDLILPGEMRSLFNRVIEAQKEAEANVIARREETAAVRSMAQTAKVLQENPLLVRLKELEAYKELAAKVGTLHVVMGEGAMSKLELKT